MKKALVLLLALGMLSFSFVADTTTDSAEARGGRRGGDARGKRGDRARRGRKGRDAKSDRARDARENHDGCRRDAARDAA